jgi:hypothetical protein
MAVVNIYPYAHWEAGSAVSILNNSFTPTNHPVKEDSHVLHVQKSAQRGGVIYLKSHSFVGRGYLFL